LRLRLRFEVTPTKSKMLEENSQILRVRLRGHEKNGPKEAGIHIERVFEGKTLSGG
jgi:hypothetical protein